MALPSCERLYFFEKGKLISGTEIDIATQEENDYFFHFPEAGDLKIKVCNGRESINIDSNSYIEAGFSHIDNHQKKILRNRLWCSAGYYNENGEFIYRPELLTNVMVY